MQRISEDDAKTGELWLPEDETGRRAVREELDRLLASDEIKSSKRYASFLTFGVEHSLKHNNAGVKERTVGIEVFGRAPDYDTSSDPIVRVTAAELRKRIAHYYSNPAHKSELHILLPIGSYIPVFSKPLALPPECAPAAAGANLGGAAVPASLPPKRRGIRKRIWVPALTVIVVIAAGYFFIGFRVRAASPLDAFWSPFAESKGPVLICIADQPPQKVVLVQDAEDPLRQVEQNTGIIQRPASVALADTVPLLAVANLLHAKGREYRVEGQSVVTLTDLRQSPDILIGAYDNAWTLMLTRKLRFHFANDPAMSHFWITDSEHPGQRAWIRDIHQVGKDVAYTDYGLVARFVAPGTDQETVVVAGLGDAGTAAAGDVLSRASVLQRMGTNALRAFAKGNVEMVIATNVIKGHHGAPRILALDTW